jgi:hypothetical protein
MHCKGCNLSKELMAGERREERNRTLLISTKKTTVSQSSLGFGTLIVEFTNPEIRATVPRREPK